MRKKVDAGKIWYEICHNCNDHEISFYGVLSTVFEDTLRFIEKIDNPVDKFSLATLAKDKVAIDALYNSIGLSEYQRNLISKLLENNNELLMTLNPYVLDPKFEFLTPVLDTLVVDPMAQDKLLSLNDYEISVLKRIVEYSTDYGVNPSNIIATIIDNIGCSSVPMRNDEKRLNWFEHLFRLLQDYEMADGIIDKKMLSNIAIVLKEAIVFPSTIDEIINYNDAIKDILKEQVEDKDVKLEELKENLVLILFSMGLSDANSLIKDFNIDGISEEYYTNPGVVELLALRMLLETDDIEQLKEVANEFINNPDYEINLFNNSLIEENLLLLYAKEFNKCKPKFSDDNFLGTKEGIKFYDSGENFYAIVKTLGAFSGDGKDTENYYLEWNDNRYRSHVNAVSLIRHDNLAFAEQDGNVHIKLGFLNFDEKMFLGGGVSDINSSPYSREMLVKIYSKLYFPEDFINHTRRWHNELDYERKDRHLSSSEFKKNPDFIILDQEVEDIDSLDSIARKQYDEYLANSIKAAKEFGNIPILVINREKIAKNEIKMIRTMLDDYTVSHDMNLLKGIITKFNNNRNGCRGSQHQYIRENYFSNEFFQDLLNEIDDNILVDQRQEFKSFLSDEYKKMASCSYDKTTLDLPIVPNKTDQKRGGLSV